MKRRLVGFLLGVLVACGSIGGTVCAGTPEIIIDGVVVQEKQTPKLLEACEMIQAQFEADAAAGIRWEYHNSKKYSDESWQHGLSVGKRGCNCALLARWALRESGLVGQNEGFFYGKGDGSIKWGRGAYEAISRTCDIIHVNGSMTVGQAIDSGQLRAGDIVTYQDFGHTNIYAGGDYWYDAGHGNCTGSGEGAVFNTFYSKKTGCRSNRIAYIIHPRGDDIVITDIMPDIVITNVDTSGSTIEMPVDYVSKYGRIICEELAVVSSAYMMVTMM